MCKIIIADDEYLEREFLKSVISSIPDVMVVGEVNSGKKAVEFCSALKPELIFLNVRMGGLSGIEAAKHIKDENKDIAVVLTSGYAENSLKQELRELEVEDYLLKPIKPAKIEIIVKRYSKNHAVDSQLSLSPAYKKRIKFYPKCLMSEPVNSALAYIDENFNSDLSLEEVAQAVYLSSYYFSRLFKKEVGVTFSSYVIYKKIEEAKRLLEYSNKSVLEISASLSFKEQNYFCKVFKKLTGFTPTEYRVAANQKITDRKKLINTYIYS